VPTLIASIYGMNVPIPYKDTPYAFWIPVIISLMILIVVGWNYIKRVKK
jgi:magnesium transporter